MTKKTSGEGWALIRENDPVSAKQSNTRSPKPIIRLEKRCGKHVTVVSGLHTYGSDRLNEIARELKTGSGAGGTVKNGIIEIQGDKVAMIQAYFKKKTEENK
jgi:translation initiation factor 1 (eIF-1/SUI1)